MNHDLIYCPKDFITDMEHVKFKKGETIIKPYTYPDYVYVVLEGIANVSYMSGKGRIIVASQFLRGDFIGEMNAICNQEYIFEAFAYSDMELVKIPAKVFIERMKTDFKLVQSMVQSQNNRINYIEAFMVLNSTFSLYEKVLLFLCCFLARDEFKRPFTKEFLVQYTGTDIRCINRVLKEMSQKGLIKTKNGKIHIEDYKGLMQEAKSHDIDSQIDFFYNYILDGFEPFMQTRHIA